MTASNEDLRGFDLAWDPELGRTVLIPNRASEGHDIQVWTYPGTGEYVALCKAFPSLSWIEDTANAAYAGMVKLLAGVEADLAAEAP